MTVDLAGVGNSVLNGRAGDFVKHHAMALDLGLQIFLEVGRDGLSLAVFVGCEIHHGGVLQIGLQVFHNLLAALGELVGSLEMVVYIDRHPLAGEVGNVAHRGSDDVLASEELRDGFGLGRRFDDDEWFSHMVCIC